MHLQIDWLARRKAMALDGSESRFRVQQIDHVEVYVPSRREAARWYRETLGLEILASYEHLAEHQGGPLMISSDDGSTKIALFTGKPRGRRSTAGWYRLAFRVDAKGFRTFLLHATRQGLQDSEGSPLGKASVKDHGQAFSVYFSDPWGHRLEITCYEADDLRQWLGEEA